MNIFPGPYKNIIFDYGGVILNIDFSHLAESFGKIGVSDFEKKYSILVKDPVFTGLETGRTSPSAFRERIRQLTGIPADDLTIDKAWNSMLLDMPEERIRLLESLRAKYHIFLLSNTNPIHYRFYTNMLYRQYGYRNFSELFHKAYFSFKLGMKKPESEIYEFVLKDSRLIPSETLFIDDSTENIAGAEKTGIRGYLLKKDKDICEFFKEFV